MRKRLTGLAMSNNGSGNKDAEQLTEYDTDRMWSELQMKRPACGACPERIDWDIRELYR